MTWMNAEELRAFIKSPTSADQEWLMLAADVACGKVEELCGPIAWTEVTGELVELAGSTEACLKWRATRGLVDVTGYLSGAALDVADYHVDGRVLKRRDGGAMRGDLLISYRSGYFDADDPNAKPPAWARSMALHIAQQYLTTMRRFSQNAEPPARFLVPNVALEDGHDYLLAPAGGVG